MDKLTSINRAKDQTISQNGLSGNKWFFLIHITFRIFFCIVKKIKAGEFYFISNIPIEWKTHKCYYCGILIRINLEKKMSNRKQTVENSFLSARKRNLEF